jgi:hypothetical protein
VDFRDATVEFLEDQEAYLAHLPAFVHKSLGDIQHPFAAETAELGQWS